MLVDIALGKGRNAATWQNRQMPFADLAARCATPQVTVFTMKEYLSFSKERQAEIKDVGAFMPGVAVGGRREKKSVLYKQVLALDADSAKPDLWNAYVDIFGAEAFYYTTHKHTPQAPRLRICILADRPMEPDEYEPVCRYVTGLLGIDQFDPTCYDVNRLMYFPSIPKDGEFLHDVCHGLPLNVDNILATYRDWRDISAWPMGDGEVKQVHSGLMKMGDQREKPGAVGLFNRTYLVEEAIQKFLPTVYLPADEDRYTYFDASTTGGLQIHTDGTTAHSYHNTDPLSGKSFGAFQMVLTHLFGHLDVDSNPDTPVNRLPSFTAMTSFVMQDAGCKRTMMSERLQELQDDFGAVSLEPEDVEWLAKLETDKRGEILNTYDNVELIMRRDVNIRQRFRFNEFSGQIDVFYPTPWAPARMGVFPVTDDDERGMRVYFGKEPYKLKAGSVIDDIYPILAKEFSYHPVKDYLNALRWDGVPRAETMVIDYLGAEDTELTRVFTRKWLCAAVARIFAPGTKFDYVLTLIGPEAARKSTLARSLGLKWFSETFNFTMLSGGNGVRAYEQLRGRWIIEIPEMAGLRKAEVEAAKSFLSASEDSYRISHGIHNSNFLRQNVFLATSNVRTPLIGSTGHRRFWIIDTDPSKRTKTIDGAVIPPETIGQVWAEIMQIYLTEPLFLTKELDDSAKLLQMAHTETDDREGAIARFLEIELPAGHEDMQPYELRAFFESGPNDYLKAVPGNVRENVCAAQIWVEALGGDLKSMTSNNTKFVHEFMRKVPYWEPTPHGVYFKNYGKQRAYRRLF